MSSAWLTVQFFRLGMQYYISGRYAVAAYLAPVAGNHFHHAIEMFLKGAMADAADEKVRRNWGHRLHEVWDVFKQRHPSKELTAFDELVADLDRFEDIRYPEKIVADGMMLTFQFGKSIPVRGLSDVPHYHLSVGDIDELVKEIFVRSSINPRFFPRNPDEDRYLQLNNDEARFWGPPEVETSDEGVTFTT